MKKKLIKKPSGRAKEPRSGATKADQCPSVASAAGTRVAWRTGEAEPGSTAGSRLTR